MAKFCEYCGAPLQEGAKFCTGCGHPVAVKSQPSQQRQQSQQPRQGQSGGQTSQSQSRQPYEPQPNNQIKFQPSAQAAKMKETGNKKKGGCVKTLLIVALIAVLGYGGWEYYQNREAKRTRERLTKDYPEKMKELEQRQQKTGGSQGAEDTTPTVLETKKGSLSADSPAVTLCGVTVEASPEMLANRSEPITVSKMETSVGMDGVRSENYELEMGQHKQFDEPVKVTFPCSVAANTDVMVTHYDAEEGEWMPLLSFMDKENGTVSAYFGSFSPVKVSYVPVGIDPKIYVVRQPYSNEPYVLKFGVSSNYLNILKRINPSVYSPEVNKFAQNPQNYSVKMPVLNKGMSTKTAYEAFKDASVMWTFCDPLINLGMESLPPSSQQRAVQFLIDNSGKVGNFMNAVPFVVMGAQVCFDLHEASKNLSDKDALKTPAVNLYKNLFSSSGTIYSLAANYSHIGFSLAFFGVALIGMEIDYFVDEAKAAKVENVENVFNAYYTKTQPIDGHHWYTVFKDAYWKNDGNIKAAMQDLKDAVDDYCEKFWRDVYDSNSDDFWFAIGDSRYRKVFEDATQSQRESLTEQQKRKVWQLIEYESMGEIEDFLMVRMQEKIYKQLYKNPLINEYNKELTIKIQETLGEESGQAQYAGRTICLGGEGIPFKDWYYNIEDSDDVRDLGWTTEFLPCTVYGYMKMGMPNQVLIYKSEEDFKSGKEPIETKDFEPDLKNGYTTVELTEKMKDEYYFNVDVGNLSLGDEFCMNPVLSTSHLKSHVKFMKNGDFSITSSGEYKNDDGSYSDETSVVVNGHIDKKTGKGTFTMKGTIKQNSWTYTVETSGEATTNKEYFNNTMNNIVKNYDWGYPRKKDKGYLYFDMDKINSNKGVGIIIRSLGAPYHEQSPSHSRDFYDSVEYKIGISD